MQESVKSSRDLLSFFNHELRTPVHGIQGVLRLLRHTGLSDQQRAYAENLEQSSANLHHSVNAILDYLKLEENKLNLDYRPVSIKSFLSELINYFDQKSQCHFNEREINLVDVPEYVLADTDRVRFIINAIYNYYFRFHKDRKVSLKVSAQKIDRRYSEAHFVFEAINDGPETFDWSAGRINTCNLDFLVAKRLLKLLDGHLHQQEQGNRLTVECSLRFEHYCKDNLQPAWQARRVLLAEDEPVSRKIALQTLLRNGFEVDAVENGRDAVAAFKNKDYDLILMDVQMPFMEGTEAARLIRKIEDDEQHSKRVFIVALTAESQFNQRIECINAGMDDYMLKPLAIENLPLHLMEEV